MANHSTSYKLPLSIIAIIALSILCLFIALITLFSVHRDIFITILVIFYISLVLFFILWNIVYTRKIFLLLIIPVLCIISTVIVITHNNYVQNLPTVGDQAYIHRYLPFNDNNHLVSLDTPANYQITNNFPILDGATALYPVYASFVQAVYPKDDFRANYKLLLCNRTDGAYDNLLDATVDIIFCAGPSSAQLNQFTEKGLNIRLVPIGKEAFVFFVNIRNPVSNLTIENIQGIYSGRITNWRELNGRNQRIRAFQRPENSGSQTMLQKIMANVPIMSPRTELVPGMAEILEMVATYRNFEDSIGYSFLFFTTAMVRNDQIKLLSVNGIFPSIESIQNNSYPFSDTFYAIYIDDEAKNENIEAFIEWILSEQGQNLIQRTGYVPIN